MGTLLGGAEKANQGGDIETGQAKPDTAKKAYLGEIETGRVAAELVRQLTRSRSKDFRRSISKAWDLHTNPEKDALVESKNPPGIFGKMGELLSNLPEWLKYVLGALAFTIYPLYQRLRKAEDDIEDSVTTLLQVVERVAEVTNKLANDLADILPNDTKLKVAVKTVGAIASKVDKDAETAQAFLKMVDELGDDFDEYVNPFIQVGDLFTKEKIGVKNEKKLLTNAKL